MGGSPSAKQDVNLYYIDLHMAICHGPVKSINRVFYDEKPLPGVSLDSSEGNQKTVLFDDTNFMGGDLEEGGLSGNIELYLGGATQKLTREASHLFSTSDLPDPTPDDLPGFRGIASVLFRGRKEKRPNGVAGRATGYSNTTSDTFYIGANNAYIKTFWFDVTRYPIGPDGITAMPDPNTCNPADLIWETLTNSSWGGGVHPSFLDVESFRQARNTLQAEGFGLALLWVQPTDFESFISEILDHVQATLSLDPTTGLLRFRLLRADYDEDSLFVLHENNAKLGKVQRKIWGEIANEVVVTWTNPENEEEESVAIQDLALNHLFL